MAKSSTSTLHVRVKVLPAAEGLPLPAAQSDGAAGLDLLAAVPTGEPMTLAPGKWAAVPTGLMLELPPGTEAQVRPRSGLAFKHGVTVLNSPGTIDSDYRGEVKVLLVNLGPDPFVIERGERIAQMVVAAHARVRLKPVADLSRTERGAGGFGSTGKSSARGAGPQKKAKRAKRAKAPESRR
jgi:dUTP pyrophosphatase